MKMEASEDPRCRGRCRSPQNGFLIPCRNTGSPGGRDTEGVSASLAKTNRACFAKAPIASAPNASCMDTLAPTARAVLREPEEARDVGERRTVHRDFWAVTSGDNKSTSKEAAESSVRLARGRTLKRWFRK